MSFHDEYYHRTANLIESGDVERAAMAARFTESDGFWESDPERLLSSYTRGRDEARHLGEPWWVLFYEFWRLNALIGQFDFTRALPLAVELMVEFNTPAGRVHAMRTGVLNHLLYTYINTDPLGFRAELEQGFAHMETEIGPGPNDHRFVFQLHQIDDLTAIEQWDQAHDLAMRVLALADRSREAHSRIYYSGWTLYRLCRVCYGLGRLDELSGHVERMAEVADQHHNLKRIGADAWAWRAYLHRLRGDNRAAAAAIRRSQTRLKTLDRRDSFTADPLAYDHEAAGRLDAAIAVRDRELVEVTHHGAWHRVAQVRVERCRLLRRAGKLGAEDLASTRAAFTRMKHPEWYAERLDRAQRGGVG